MAMQPGVYISLPEEEYHADPALGSSGIKLLLKSPALYWDQSYLNPNKETDEEEDTTAKKFGRAYHKLIREPEKFDSAFKIKEGVKTSKIPGTIGEGEHKKLLKMRAQLANHPKQLALLVGGVPEVSIFFEYEHRKKKYMCKVRFDTFAPHWVSDLKTTRDISDRGLRYTFGDYGYDISGAMYSIGAKCLKEMIRAGYKMPAEFDAEFIKEFLSEEDQIFAFVFQEKESPHLTRAWCMTPWISEIGRDKFHKGLDIYEENIALQAAWPTGYADIEDIDESMLSNTIQFF
jgi:PDDEXK-like domain of unknown function (DUF3799)